MNANSKQNSNGVRSAQDLERKYDFASLLGLKKNLETQKQKIAKISNEINNMLNTLIINLKDVIENQSEISLWFFSGIPTTTNKPYIDWTDVSEHFGDIYYNQETGYVYQYSESGWNRNNDTNLVQAMALTNVELDTTTDHERKIYFSQPEPPYCSGDWWILEDGTLKICQLGKTEGSYDSNDFVVSSKYTSTLATKTENTITVLKGTLIALSENAVTFEDLSTGGKTSINGSNINTGNINTDNVSIGNGNVKLDADGIKLKNGAKVVGTNGLMNTYIFKNQKFDFCGYYISDYISVRELRTISIAVMIPNGLKITNAYLKIYHSPVYWGYYDANDNAQNVWGYCRNLKLYKATNVLSRAVYAQIGSEYDATNTTTYSEIKEALGDNGWTPSASSNSKHDTESYTSPNISNVFSDGAGLYEFLLRPAEDINTSWGCGEGCERSGYVYAEIVIDGYMSYE